MSVECVVEMGVKNVYFVCVDVMVLVEEEVCDDDDVKMM